MAKILIVEDDNNLREIYEARLQAEGYNVVSAHDGEEALVVAKNEKPDLIISDVMMPKISGFEMLDILRNTEGLKDVRVIILTALGQSDDQKRADKLGADRYLVKSQVTLEDIVKVTQQSLESANSNAKPETSDSSAAPVASVPLPSPVQPEVAQAKADSDKTAPEIPIAIISEPIPTTETTDKDNGTAPQPTDNVEPTLSSQPSSSDDVSSNSSDNKTNDDQTDDHKDTTVESDLKLPLQPATSATAATASTSSINPANDDAVAKVADSAKDEEHKVQSQIESFINNNQKTSEPTKPTVQAKPLKSDVQATTSPTATITSTNFAPPPPAIKPDDLSATEKQEPIDEDKPSTGDTTKTDQPDQPMTVGGIKVIKPIESHDDKPDINTLLAEEESKEGAEELNSIVGNNVEPTVMKVPISTPEDSEGSTATTSSTLQ